MDVQMPVLNGLDASRHIRHHEAQTGRAPTPIIALTASVLEQDVREAREAGMNGFASKPVDLHRLTHEIARLLRLDDAVGGSPAIQSVPTVSGSVVDWRTGAQLWGSEARHRQSVRRFLGDYESVVTQLRQMLDAPQSFGALAHKLRGASGNLALPRVCALCATLEERSAAGDLGDIGLALDRLADELMNVHEVLAQLAPDAPDASATQQPSTALDAEALCARLDALEQALAHGELAEGPWAALGAMLAPAALEPLSRAMDAFDFELALHLVRELRARYTPPTENVS
jgi:CheY-like chemotaxis protein